jgi:hypothetical protein
LFFFFFSYLKQVPDRAVKVFTQLDNEISVYSLEVIPTVAVEVAPLLFQVLTYAVLAYTVFFK